MCGARRGLKKAEGGAWQDLRVLRQDQPLLQALNSRFLLAKHG